MPLLRGNIITGENLPGISDGIIYFTDTIHWIGSVQNYIQSFGEQELPAFHPGYITPGLVDVHCHGGYGGSFPSSDSAGVLQAIHYHRSQGTTSLLASTVSADETTLWERLDILSESVATGLLTGIHLEGPFLDHCRCGAQDSRYIIPGDMGFTQRLLSRANGTVRSMTLAPETPHAMEIAHILHDNNAIASWGHTSASAYVARQALNLTSIPAGHKDTITHIFNGMNPFHHRDPGMIGESFQALRAGVVAAELIADGIHLTSDTIKMMFSLFAVENLILISDAMEATGMGDGLYRLGSHEVQVVQGVARILENGELGSIAGGTSTLADIVRYTVCEAGIPLYAAISAATLSPALAIGLAADRGSLTPGKRADILLWDTELCPGEVYVQGSLL